MAKATWRGYLTIGQLGLPVRLYNATKSHTPRFVLLHDRDGSAVERVLRCKEEQKDISSADTVRAVEVEPGKYITLTDNELERVSEGPVKTIGVQQFCDPITLAPAYFDKPYYIVACKGGERAYALLREVLERTQKVAVTRYFLYRREHIGLVGVRGDLLMLYQLRFASEIAPRSELKTPALPRSAANEIETLSAVVERYSSPFYIEDYHDTYADAVDDLIDRKARGLKQPTRRSLGTPAVSDESELVDALQQTLRSPAGLVRGQ